MAKRAITLFPIDKKTKNRASMVVKMGGFKKAKKIEAALFSLWCHPRRRRLKNRRRWFHVCAEWKIRLSLSSPPPWEEDARIDDDGSERRLACSSPTSDLFSQPKKGVFFGERAAKIDDDGDGDENVGEQVWSTNRCVLSTYIFNVI